MTELTDYQTAYKQESFGSPFNFGIRIDVDAPNGVTEPVKRLCYSGIERKIGRTVLGGTGCLLPLGLGLLVVLWIVL